MLKRDCFEIFFLKTTFLAYFIMLGPYLAMYINNLL